MKTGPGRHTGPTEGEGEVTTDREGSQQEPNTKPEKAGPSHTHEGAQQKQQKTRDTQTETTDRKPKNPKGRSPKGNAKTQKGQRAAETTSNELDRVRKGHAGRGGAIRKIPTGAKGPHPTKPGRQKRNRQKAQRAKMKASDPEKRGGGGKGKSLCLATCGVFEVVLFVCSESVIPAVPNRKGDRVRPFCPCGKEP